MRLIANIIFYTTYSVLCCTQHKDDVITKGLSYATYANQLESLGANVLGGIFLARTHYKVK